MSQKINYIYGVVILLIVCLAFSAFIVTETEQAIVTEFGKVKRIINKPGLNWKIPFIQKVIKFDNRVLEWDGDVTEIPTYDKKFIFVDTFARWKISNPLEFYKACVDENGAQEKIDHIINGAVRDDITQRYMPELIRATNKYPVIIGIEYKDKNNNGEYDKGEECDTEMKEDCSYLDLSLPGLRDEIIANIFKNVSLLVNEKYIDESFIDLNGNGLWDTGEEFTDSNKDQVWTSIESYDDKNENNKYDEGEKYTDINSNKKYDNGIENPDFLNLGIEILDVQIKRLRYTATVERELFTRMISEQLKIAERFRGEGQGKKLEILGDQTKKEKELISIAYKTAQEIKGVADATATRIYANAYGANADFYLFYKSLETYKNTLDPSTLFFLSTDMKYLKYLEDEAP